MGKPTEPVDSIAAANAAVIAENLGVEGPLDDPFSRPAAFDDAAQCTLPPRQIRPLMPSSRVTLCETIAEGKARRRQDSCPPAYELARAFGAILELTQRSDGQPHVP